MFLVIVENRLVLLLFGAFWFYRLGLMVLWLISVFLDVFGLLFDWILFCSIILSLFLIEGISGILHI